MKIEVRCATCGKGYLVEETKVPAGGGFVPCQACGAMIVLGARAAEPAPMAAQSVPTAPSTPATVLVAAAPAAGNEVCCPRCGLHFSPTAERQVEPSTRPTVLLVEDLDYFVEIARDALAGRYELKCAKTVAEARAFLKQGGIDLMLLDLMLEGSQEGLRLLREPPGKTCPVLLFTAQDESEMYGEGWTKLQSLGVDDVVIKGMNMGEMLTRKVAALLGEPLPHDAMNR